MGDYITSLRARYKKMKILEAGLSLLVVSRKIQTEKVPLIKFASFQ